MHYVTYMLYLYRYEALLLYNEIIIFKNILFQIIIPYKKDPQNNEMLIITKNKSKPYKPHSQSHILTPNRYGNGYVIVELFMLLPKPTPTLAIYLLFFFFAPTLAIFNKEDDEQNIVTLKEV